MVEKAAEDYATIFRSVKLETEIDPVCGKIDDMLARLDEFEALLANVKSQTNSITEYCVGTINRFKEFENLRSRIDALETFVNSINTNVDEMERAVDIAEEELNVTDYSLKGLLLKPLLNKTVKSDITGEEAIRSNLKDGNFQGIKIFQCNEFFPPDLESEEEVTILEQAPKIVK